MLKQVQDDDAIKARNAVETRHSVVSRNRRFHITKKKPAPEGAGLSPPWA